jgi:hypothetical protein
MWCLILVITLTLACHGVCTETSHSQTAGGQHGRVQGGVQGISIKSCRTMPYSLQLQLHLLSCLQLLSEATDENLCPDPMNLLVSQLLLPQSIMVTHFLGEARIGGEPVGARLTEEELLTGIKAGLCLQRELALRVSHPCK